MGKDKDKDGCDEPSSLTGAVVFVASVSTCAVCGTWWIPYVVVLLVLSSVIGYYTEAKINQLDDAIRAKANEKYGRRLDGETSDLGLFARRTCQVTGLLFPAIPAVMLCVALYLGYKKRKIEKIPVKKWGCQKKLCKGFDAPGRFVF